MRNNGYALQHVSWDLCDDPEIVLEAVKNRGRAIQYASEHLQDDRDFILQAVKKNGNVFFWMKKDLQSDRAIVLKALKGDAYALKYASEDLKDDFGLILEDGDALRYVSGNLRNYMVVKLALTRWQESNCRVKMREMKCIRPVFLENNIYFLGYLCRKGR